MSIWQELPRPFFVLAPMDDVTDIAFRQIVAAAAPPEVFFTEFVSVDGLLSAGHERTLERLRIEPDLSQPLITQIWGNDPEKFYRAAAEIAAIGGFAGIDINMGCPERSVVARGCGGGLIGQNSLAAEIIAATREGAAQGTAGRPPLPVSVKTRLGRASIATQEWCGWLLQQRLAALTVHARTVREMSRVPARWDEIAQVAQLRDQLAPDTVIIGNGDVTDRAHGLELASASGADGVMIGRGIFRNLFCFATTPADQPPPPADMIAILCRHLDLYEATGATKPYQTLKKFFKIYISGWSGAAELRARLMDTHSPAEARQLISHLKLT